MNREAQILRGALDKVVKLLTQQGVRVTFQGAQPFVSADPKSGKFTRLNLPAIPDNAPASLLRALNGYLDHEVGHMLFTDMKKVNDFAGRDGSAASLHNLIEDVRLEKLLPRELPGTRSNLERMYETFIPELIEPSVKQAVASGDPNIAISGLMVPAMRALGGQKAFQDFMDANGYWSIIKPLIDRIPDFERDMAAMETQEDVESLVRRLLAARTPPPPPQQPQQPQQPDENEGDGNGEGTKSEDAESDKNQSDSNNEGDEKSDADSPEGEDADEGGSAAPEEEADESEDGESEGSADQADETDAGEAGGDGGEGEDAPDEPQKGSGAGDQTDDGEDDDNDDESASEGQNQHGEGGGGEGKDRDSEQREGDTDSRGEVDGAPQDDESGITDAAAAAQFEFDPTQMGDFETMMGEKIAAEMGDLVSQSGSYNVFTRDNDTILEIPVSADQSTSILDDKVRATVAPLQKDLQRLIVARSQATRVPGQRSGKIHSASLHRVLSNDDRVFTRKKEAPKLDTAITLLMDCSSSMMGTRAAVAIEAIYAMSEALSRVNVPFEALGFTTKEFKMTPAYTREVNEFAAACGSGGVARYLPVQFPMFKEFAEPFGARIRQRLSAAYESQGILQMGATPEVEGLEFATERLQHRGEKRKIMIVLHDGAPNGHGAQGVWHGIFAQRVKEIVAENMRQGIDMVGIGIQTSAGTGAYPKHIQINDLAGMPPLLMSILKEYLLKQ